LNALRVALGIVRGKFILIFGIAERLLAFRYPIFTGGVWRETAFAAPLSAKARRCGANLHRFREASARPGALFFSRKLCRHAKDPISKGAGTEQSEMTGGGSFSRREPSPSSLRDARFLKVGARGSPRKLYLFAKASPFDRLPRPGEVARSARRGIRWISEAKTERARLLPLCDFLSLLTPAICAITTTFREKVSSPRWRKPKAGAGESRF